MTKLCEQCGQKDCGFVNRGMEDDCEKVQWYLQGYDAAVDKACEWLTQTMVENNWVSGYTDIPMSSEDVELFIKAMEGGEE